MILPGNLLTSKLLLSCAKHNVAFAVPKKIQSIDAGTLLPSRLEFLLAVVRKYILKISSDACLTLIDYRCPAT